MPANPDIDALNMLAFDDGRVFYLKSEVDKRDGAIARYIIALRGAWFSCANQLATVRDYYKAQE